MNDFETQGYEAPSVQDLGGLEEITATGVKAGPAESSPSRT